MSDTVEIDVDVLEELVGCTNALVQRDLSDAGHRPDVVGWDVEAAIEARDEAKTLLEEESA